MKNDTPSGSMYTSKKLHSDMTDEEWKQVFEFKKDYAKLNRIGVEYRTWETLKKEYITQLKPGIHQYFLIWKKGKAFGTLVIYEKRKTGREYSLLKHDLPILYFDEEILEKILTCYLSFCPDSTYLVVTSTDVRNDYLEHLFPIEVSEVRELFELKLKNINKDVFSNWSRICSDYKEEFDVVLKDEIPARLLDDFCKLTSELNQDVVYKSRLFDVSYLSPEQLVRQQELYKKRGIVQLLLLLIDNKENKLVGYTDVSLDPNAQDVAFQNMTGLARKYRGRGLSKLLKVRMLQKLQERFSDLLTIKTGIHRANLRSQNLNRKLGFRQVGVYKEYIISRHAIQSYLS